MASTKSRNAVANQKSNDKENTHGQLERASTGRERRPSDKVIAQKQEAVQAALLKAQKAERRALREKKAQRKERQEADLPSDGEGDYDERPDAQFTSRIVTAKPATLAYRKTKVPAAPASRSVNVITTSDESEDEVRPVRSRSPQRDVSRSRSGSCGPNGLSSREPSRSPQVGNKRSHDDDSDVDENMEHGLLKAQKINNNTGRPKAADYDDSSKEVILAAATSYRVLLAVRNAFPDPATDNGLVKEAWQMAVEETGCALALTPDLVRIVKARSSQVRGEAKTKTTTLVEALYSFDSGNGRRVMAENRKKAEELKHEKGFLYRAIADDEGRKGIYSHPIIQRAVNAMWFKNRRDEGITFTKYFQPLPVPAIALILTAIECNIDEWLTGTKTDITFWADEYRTTYNSHIKSLTEFGAHTKSADLLGRLQRRLYNYGRHHAGAPPAELDNVSAIPLSAFAAALKEYQEDSGTDSEGEMMMP